MFGRATRELAIKATAIIERVEIKFDDHVRTQYEREDRIFCAIKEAHENCPEGPHLKQQNGTLKRMEENYEKMRISLSKELEAINVALSAVKGKRDGKREQLIDICKLIAIICTVLGAVYGYMQYHGAKSGNHKTNNTVEMRHEND